MDLSLQSDRPLKQRLYDTFLVVLIYSNIWVSAAIASLVPFVQLTLGLAPDWRPTALIFTSALVPYLLDRLVDAYVQKIPDQKAQAFFKQPGSLLLFAIASTATAILIWTAPPQVQLVCLGGLVPLLYGLPLFPLRHQGSWRWCRLKDIPGSKAWIVCGTITYAVVTVPLAYANQGINSSAALVGLFLLVFIGSNSHVFDIRDIESDQRKGVMTMPVLLGAWRTRWVLTALNLGLLGLLIGVRWQGGLGPDLKIAIPAVGVTLAYIWQIAPDTPRNVYSIWIDGVLFLPLFLVKLAQN
ncbi:MAG: UbiA family prenyltransferase [Elainellaceae cyanobacterium]